MSIIFQGMKIHIENEVGSVRKGKDKDGKPWEVIMTYAYGEILGSVGMDGDPVDCFIGSNKSAKFVYVVHQTKKDGSGWDEDKCMLGFDDAMSAKKAYYKNFDLPDHFYGSIEAIPLAVFKKKVFTNKVNQMIHASKMNTVIALYAQEHTGGPGIGTPVTVDGFHGRGIVTKRNGNRLTVKFRNGLYISRAANFVHSMDENTVNKMWRD